MSKYLRSPHYHYKDFKIAGSTYRAHVLDLVYQIEKHLDPASSILDVGCGEGLIMAKLKERGFKVRGCDIDPHAVDQGLEKGHDIEQGTIFKMKAGENSYDAVLLCDVLEHVEDLGKTIEQVCTAARKIVVIAVPDRPDAHAVRSISPEDIRQHMGEYTFEEKHFDTRHARHLFIFEVSAT